MIPAFSNPASLGVAAPAQRHSILPLAVREAHDHRWILGQRLGYDVGPAAWQQWIQRYWKIFYRHRWVEHLRGQICWLEFPLHQFDLVNRELRGIPGVEAVLQAVARGCENLDLIWGTLPHLGSSIPAEAPAQRPDWSPADLGRILEVIDMNAIRTELAPELVVRELS
jgi:hypothetical protein